MEREGQKKVREKRAMQRVMGKSSNTVRVMEKETEAEGYGEKERKRGAVQRTKDSSAEGSDVDVAK